MSVQLPAGFRILLASPPMSRFPHDFNAWRACERGVMGAMGSDSPGLMFYNSIGPMNGDGEGTTMTRGLSETG